MYSLILQKFHINFPVVLFYHHYCTGKIFQNDCSYSRHSWVNSLIIIITYDVCLLKYINLILVSFLSFHVRYIRIFYFKFGKDIGLCKYLIYTSWDFNLLIYFYWYSFFYLFRTSLLELTILIPKNSSLGFHLEMHWIYIWIWGELTLSILYLPIYEYSISIQLCRLLISFFIVL